MRIGVTGANGRMGRAVIDAAIGRNVAIAFAVNRHPGSGGSVESVSGIDVEPAGKFASLLDSRNPDAVVDFTGPSSTVEYAERAAAASVPIVIGTTGFDAEQRAALEAAGDSTPVLLGANFARGLQALIGAVESALAALPGYDVEVTETHHNEKRDAPSGTAGVILDRIEAARGEPGEHVYGREGEARRHDGEIGVHARRAGDVTGEHEILLAGNREVLELTHRAGSRAVFAEGSLDAARWLIDQPAGFYRFADIADQLT